MDDLLLLILIAFIMGLSVLTTNWYLKPVMAVSIGNTGRAFIIQEQVNTGNPVLDKEINKFYSCISKTHQDPPIIQIWTIAIQIQYQNNGPGNHNHNNNSNNNNNNNDIIKTPSSRSATPPPGVLVEVP